MHSNKLVVALKHNGKVLREQKDKDGNVTTFLPFGSEYSIFIKNLNSVRALVRVSLDGQSVTDGEDLVVYGNDELNLERFLKAGNMNNGNKFKFIERSAKVEAHRGIEAEDGLLRVEFQFEKVTPKPVVVETIHKHYYNDYYKYNPWYYHPSNPYRPYDMTCGSPSYGINNMSLGDSSGGLIGNAIGSATANVCSTTSLAQNAACGGTTSVNLTSTLSSSGVALRSLKKSLKKSSKAAVAEAQAMDNIVNDAGITVAGSVSDQKFQNAAWFAVDDEKFVIVLKLLGEAGGQTIEKPVLVRQKQTCPTCGTRNRGQNKCCRECGTFLSEEGQSPKRSRVTTKR